MKIADKVFVVTGGGNGMGREIVLGLAARGARVAALDLNGAGLAETLRLAGQVDGRVTAHEVNVTDRDAVRGLPALVEKTHGSVDGIVNIAGVIHRFVHFSELTEDEEQRVMNVNFWGTVNMCRTFLPILRERPEAIIVNMSSLAALLPFAGQSFYGASKGAVKQFSEGLYAELLDTSVAVSTIFPGNISTNLTGNSGVKMIDAGGRKVRVTTPADAGRQIVDGIAKRKFRILVGGDARVLDKLARISPRRATRFIADQMKSVL
ncbi:SDR family NAD(P)-dependent oxidoreductase [Agromyces albus]|uniref:SDR family NAD(P)-dependent oxidoreductase n=1 Tax=Agromyces albus TaxID=205332 RepID=A0A4Q2L349_9MICO|nr:SDR family oxidoreductase [Agromyces albus]RXZ71867.1 SDR family NAD(P)-dependent oxidoreductase [Agromyces albus]